MAESKRDQNGVTTFIGASSSDGSTPVNVKVDATTHALQIDDGSGGSDVPGETASRDENYIPVAMGVSSDDGVTPTEIYVDVLGNLLTKST